MGFLWFYDGALGLLSSTEEILLGIAMWNFHFAMTYLGTHSQNQMMDAQVTLKFSGAISEYTPILDGSSDGPMELRRPTLFPAELDEAGKIADGLVRKSCCLLLLLASSVQLVVSDKL